MRVFVKESLVSGAIKAGNAFLSLATVIVLTRTLGPDGFGIYTIAFVLVVIMSVLIELGLPRLTMRETAQALDDTNWPLIFQFWHWSTRFVLWFSALTIPAAAFIAYLFAERMGALTLVTFYIALLLVPLRTATDLKGSALRGLGKVIAGQYPQFIIRPAVFLLLLLAVWALPKNLLTLDPRKAMMLHVIASAVAMLVAISLVRKHVPPEHRMTAPSRGALQERVWMRATMIIGFSAGMSQISKYSDILVISYFLGNIDVSIYRAVFQVSQLATFGLQVVAMVIAQRLATYHKQGNIVALQRMATVSARMALAVALPFAVLCYLFGEKLLTLLFGNAFSDGTATLVILAGGQAISAFFGTIGLLLTMSGYEKRLAQGMMVAALVNLVLNIFLVPVMGIEGAALATALTLLLWNLLFWFFACKTLQIRSDPL